MWFKTIFKTKTSKASARLFDEAFLLRLERLSYQAQRGLRGTPAGGEHPSRHQLPATLFSNHRPYSAGDDYRHVDWNAYAHHEQLHIKLGEVEQDVNVHVLLDTSRSMAWGEPSKLLVGQQLAGALGYLALAHNDRLHIAPLGTAPLRAFGPTQGKNQIIAMLRFIEELRPSGAVALGEMLHSYARAHSQGGLLLLLSDLLSPEHIEEGLRALPAPRWQVVVLHLLDRRELKPDLSGPLELEDAESGRRLALKLDAETIAAYRRNVSAWQERIAASCARRGATYAQVLTDWPIERAVVPYLRTRRILQ